jgi:hypothetical protein
LPSTDHLAALLVRWALHSSDRLPDTWQQVPRLGLYASAILDSQRFSGSHARHLDTFKQILRQSQLIHQARFGLRDELPFSIQIAIISICEAPRSWATVKSSWHRLMESIYRRRSSWIRRSRFLIKIDTRISRHLRGFPVFSLRLTLSMDQQVPAGTFTISGAIKPFFVRIGDLHPHSCLPIARSRR